MNIPRLLPLTQLLLPTPESMKNIKTKWPKLASGYGSMTMTARWRFRPFLVKLLYFLSGRTALRPLPFKSSSAVYTFILRVGMFEIKAASVQPLFFWTTRQGRERISCMVAFTRVSHLDGAGTLATEMHFLAKTPSSNKDSTEKVAIVGTANRGCEIVFSGMRNVAVVLEFRLRRRAARINSPVVSAAYKDTTFPQALCSVIGYQYGNIGVCDRHLTSFLRKLNRAVLDWLGGFF